MLLRLARRCAIVNGTDGLGKWSALPGGIFISYRRRETAWPARQLYDVLVEHFPFEQVFKDVDNIDPGDDFVDRITAAVGSCDVLLALIGPQWLTMADENGRRRLDNAEDYVRLEIETALTREIRVIPILVDDVRMPRADALPPALAPLARRQAVEINPLTFDTERLIATLRKTLAEVKVRSNQQVTGSEVKPVSRDFVRSDPLALLDAQSPGEAHYRIVADRILAGAVIPFLGTSVNYYDRPPEKPWKIGRYLPTSAELAVYLASMTRYRGDDRTDLLRMSQYVDLTMGHGPLYALLHGVYDADYPPTPIHRLLASLPSMIRAQPRRGRHRTEPRFFPLIITTNYDDLLERAFKEEGEEFDLVTYIADGSERGRFLHTDPDGVARLIDQPNSYTELRGDERPVIAKINGSVVRGMPDHDSFVITENDYIEYLRGTDIAQLIPVKIAMRMAESHFLFLGYNLKDWNLRVVLNRLWGDFGMVWNSWTVLPRPDNLEERWWGRRSVELLDARLEEYIDLLGAALISASTTVGELS